ncbi:hypothetical protein B4U79_18928 [Dinothrombium tinctorium]|uniref:LIM zinc-binding domain-containing protein n=1 Tax=Dinothrombium tinctorium TaxID=1965070 RepID=A0A443RRC4_9ACAR|nr:hypothetical protein B4U79_18928 [Dinothrombium tinctorium]
MADHPCCDQSCAISCPECPRCEQPVECSDRVIDNNRVWHRSCFICCRCYRELRPGCYLETGVPGRLLCYQCRTYCRDHLQVCGAHQRPRVQQRCMRCAVCSQPLNADHYSLTSCGHLMCTYPCYYNHKH